MRAYREKETSIQNDAVVRSYVHCGPGRDDFGTVFDLKDLAGSEGYWVAYLWTHRDDNVVEDVHIGDDVSDVVRSRRLARVNSVVLLICYDEPHQPVRT